MEKTIGVRPLIEADGVTKRYDGFTLSAVSLTVEPGQVVGFIGQNGAGKSTTIKALLGLIGIDGGEARVLGVPARDLRGASSSVKEDIGVVFDTVSMPPAPKDRRSREADGGRLCRMGRLGVRPLPRLVQAR